MKNPYPNEKFSNAVRAMATSPASIQERIANAYLYDIIHVGIEDVPESIRYRLKQLREKITSVKPVADEGSVAATTERMSTEEAVGLAREIVSLAEEIASDYYNG